MSSYDVICRETHNWSAADVFIDNRYILPDTWYVAETAKPFQPQVHYFVGGATRLYGAALYRLRAEDFGVSLPGGLPAGEVATLGLIATMDHGSSM
jgi:hypothetical protein